MLLLVSHPILALSQFTVTSTTYHDMIALIVLDSSLVSFKVNVDHVIDKHHGLDMHLLTVHFILCACRSHGT